MFQMNKVPERYKEIRKFLEGLHISNKLLGAKSNFNFYNHDDYWSSHLTLNDNARIETFSVRYMKNKDEVWIVTNFYSYNKSIDKWILNTLGYELKKQNILFEIESKKATYYGYEFFVKAKLEKDKDYKMVYDIYTLYNKYRDNLKGLNVI